MPTMEDLKICFTEGHIPWSSNPDKQSNQPLKVNKHLEVVDIFGQKWANSAATIIARTHFCARCRLHYLELPDD